MSKQAKQARVIPQVTLAVFAIVEKDRKSALSVDARVDAEVIAAHPVMMEYETFQWMLKDLRTLCEKKGLSAATNHHAKALRASVVRCYGAQPVAMGKESRGRDHTRIKEIGNDAWAEYEKVRAENDAAKKPAHVSEALAVHAAKAKKTKPVQEKPGAPSDAPKPQVKTWREQLEQLLAIDGSRSVLQAIEVIAGLVRADHSTLAQAKPLTQVRNRLAEVWKVADVTPKDGTNS